MEAINLNLIPNGTNPVVHCSQYDEGREFRFNLFDGASVFVLDGTEDISCDIKKPDGNIVTAAVPNTEDDYIIVTTTLQMTACSGNSLGTINISKGGVNLYTLNFVLYCERSPLENGIESDSAIHNLETQIAEAVADQYDADSVIFDSVPTQGHGTGFAVTSEGVANAVQDAKDYTDTAIGGLTIPENITDLADTDINTPSNGEIPVYNNGSWENQANPASTANFAPDYDDTATYNTNDKVIYQGLLYVCLEDSVTGAWDSTKWQNISVADYTAELLPIESGSATNTKSYIDSGLSGKANTGDLALKQDKAILHIKKEFANTYTIQTCIGALISEYGKNTMAFGFVLTGSGWYEGMMSFYDANQGGGYLIMNGGTPRLWAVSYQNGTVNISEK